MIKELVQQFVVGKNPFSIEAIWSDMYDGSKYANRYGKNTRLMSGQTIDAHHRDPAGQRGADNQVLRLSLELLANQERVLGRDHPSTFGNRSDIALWTGFGGKADEALRLFRALLPDQERVLGPDDPDTLATRANIALWTGPVSLCR
jgi:hypothetical protein